LRKLIDKLDEIEIEENEKKKDKNFSESTLNANPVSEYFVRELSKVLLRSEYDSLFQENNLPFINIYQRSFFKSVK
jgi:predicted dienelactone hydrolase